MLPLRLLAAAYALACLVPQVRAQAALLPPVPTGVESTRTLTLDEAKQLALANNKALTLARLNVAEKQFGAVAARKDYFPKLQGSVSYFHFDRPLGAVTVTASGKRGLLPPGTTLVNTAVVNQDAALSTVYLAQPITKLIAVNAAVQVARADADAAQAQLDKGTRDVVSGVAQAYHGLLGAQRILAALELQAKMLDEVAKARPSPEVRVALVETRQGIVQVRGQAQELTETLNNLLDLPACTILALVDPLPAELPIRCADDAARLALANHPEVREAEQGIAKAEAALKLARMEFLPDVNVLGGYANQTSADYIQDNVGYLGVAASYTFWGWGKRLDVKRQRETLVALAHQSVQVARDKAALEARKAYLAFDQARETYQLAGEMVAARTDAEKAAQGAAALQARAETAKAGLELMKAEIGYRVAHAQMAALLGHP